MIGAVDRRAATLEETHRCSQFLFGEAALLDRGDVDAWFRLLASDVIYWIPLLDAYDNPEDELNIAYDNLAKLNDRLGRLAGGAAHVQDPPSRTTRMISNIRAWRNADGFSTEATFIVHELRPGVSPVRSLAGRYLHELVEAKSGLLIRRKTIELVNRTESFSDLAFIL